MRRIIFTVSAFAYFVAIATLTGCNNYKSKKFFSDASFSEQKIAENVTITAEFQEYDKNVEEIKLTVANNGDDIFASGEQYRLQKMENDEWRDVAVQGRFTAIAYIYEPSTVCSYIAVLKDHVELPLLPGEYRIGVGFDPYPDDNDLISYAEFTIK